MDSTTTSALASKKTVGAKIEYLLENAFADRVTQAELSRRVGVSSVWINNVIRSKRQPSERLLTQIAEFFGIKPVMLFDDRRKKSLGIS